MKKLQLLTKTLLVAIGLCAGASAWAEAKTATVDFISYTNKLGQRGTKAFTFTDNSVTNALEKTLYVPEDLPELVMYNYIAVSNDIILRCGKTGATEYGNNGLWHGNASNGNKSTVYASIINLHPGDKVKLYGANVYFVSTNVTTEVTAGDAVTMQTEYEISTGTQLDLKINNGTNSSYCYIAKVEITSEYDAVSNPSIAETGVDGTAKLVTITNGKSSHDKTVTTYYTIDGTTPSATNNAGAFTEASKVLTISSNATVKAISVSDIESLVVSLDVEAGAKTPLNTPTATITGISETAGSYFPVYTFNSDNSDLAGSPIPTSYSYTFTPTIGDEESGTLTDAQYTFTKFGTITVTANIVSDSYKESEAKSVTVDAAYYKTNSISYKNLYGTGGGEWPGSLDYALTPFVSFSGFEYRTAHSSTETYYALVARRGQGTATCSLTDDMVAVFTALDGTAYTATSESNVVKLDQWRNIASYNLYVKSSAATTVSVSAAGLSTFASGLSLDFTSVSDKIVPYKATVSGSTVTLTKAIVVPAGEGVLLRSMTNGATNADVPVADFSAWAAADNEFVGTIKDITVNQIDGDYTNFVLSKEGDVVGFFKAKTEEDGGTSVGAGKAYLPVLTSGLSAGAARIKLVFDDEATSISQIENGDWKMGNSIYSLSGQRVAAPTKGLYIVNGKKVVIK